MGHEVGDRPDRHCLDSLSSMGMGDKDAGLYLYLSVSSVPSSYIRRNISRDVSALSLMFHFPNAGSNLPPGTESNRHRSGF